MKARLFLGLVGLLGLVGWLLAMPALAQTQAETTRDGEAFAKELRGRAASEIMQPGAEQNVPGFAGINVDGRQYLDDEDALVSTGSALRNSDPNYATVIDRGRPVFDPTTIDLSGAQTIEQDPEAFLGTDMQLGGAAGNCEPLPNTGTSSSVYYETCNQGDVVSQAPRTCSPRIVTQTTVVRHYRYYVAPLLTNGAPFIRDDRFAPYWATGQCRVIGPNISGCEAHDRTRLTEASRRFCHTYEVQDVECSLDVAYYNPDGSYGGFLLPVSNAPYYAMVEHASVSAARDDSSCSGLASNASCSAPVEVCSESDPVTRIIDGVAVTQPCWVWQRTYQCTERQQTSDCSGLSTRSDCQYDRRECLSENDDGSCNVFEDVYRCQTPATGVTTTEAYICSGDLYCLNGECTEVEREASTEFKDAMVAVQTLGNLRDDFDADNLTLFSGERAGCHKPVFGLINCCAGKSSGLITTAAGAAALASGPAAIGLLATPFLTQFFCDAEEKTLDVKDRMGLCHYVGTYCSDKVLGVCTSKRKSYCCFESKLSRILQEQGRAQIGKSWGTARDAECEGFQIEEFQRLDLSLMDFTEVYDEFVDAAKVPDELETSIEIQQRIEAYYDLHG